MNQSQRTFLIKKIEDNIKLKTDHLRDSRPAHPSLNNWLLHSVLSGNFELRTIDEIKEVLRKKALNAKDREDWLGNHWGTANKSDVNFKASEIFILPKEYTEMANECIKKTNEINEEIRQIAIAGESLVTRIQLASDKTLQTMINEVDDMGNISLMDTKLKLLSNG